MTIELNLSFPLGRTVYLKTDPEQKPWLLTEITIRIDGSTLYTIHQGTINYVAFEQEISAERDTLLALDVAKKESE